MITKFVIKDLLLKKGQKIVNDIMEERMIKLIWDFRGEDSFDTAKHHQIHLSDYLKRNKLEDKTGVEKKTSGHAIAWLATPESDMVELRDALIPHRAEVFEDDH